MTRSIIGFGAVGQALAKAFARQGIGVSVAARRPPEQLLAQAIAIGATIVPVGVAEAVRADTVILAMPFAQHDEIGGVLPDWGGKLVIDATNAFGVPLSRFGTGWSSGYAAERYPNARFVKAFNHLPAAKLAEDPSIAGGRRVIFVSTDDPAARGPADALIERLGYAPVSLGTLAESGPLVSAREERWSPLDFQDLIKVG